MSALLHAQIATSQIFTEFTGVLNQCDSPLLATAALAVIDIPARTVTFATAGHPPPMLRLPDGSVEKLDTANGMMIGVSSELVGEVDTAPFPSALNWSCTPMAWSSVGSARSGRDRPSSRAPSRDLRPPRPESGHRVTP